MSISVGSVIELLPEPVLVVGTSGEVLFVNRAMERELGRARTSLVGRPLAELVVTPADDLAGYLRRCAGSLHATVPGALIFRLAAGGTVHLRCDGGTGRDKEGATGTILLRCRRHGHAITHFTILAEKVEQLSQEILRRQGVEDELRESEQRFRTLADNIPLLCWMANSDGWIFWYNFRWYEYTGTTPEEMEGWGWRSVHDPDALPGVLTEWKRSIASGEPFEMVFPLKGADGVFRPFLTRVVPIHDEEGRITRWFGTNTEVNDIVEARETLARSRAELERLVEQRTAALLREVEERRRAEEALREAEKLAAIGQLTGGVAHDFNNLLQVITSGAALLKRPGLAEAKKAAILDGMIQAGQNARELTGRLLAVARRQTLRPEVLDLGRRLASMTELLEQTLGPNVQIETRIDRDLWPVRIDSSQLEVAILNLAVNARDAMPNGGTLTVEAHNVAEGAAVERVCIVMRDTGSGIPTHLLNRVLEPFFTTKEQGRGTGLGLSQVHGFVKQSGGDLRIDSKSGQGTTVTIHLPRAADVPGIAMAPEEATSSVLQGVGKTVLVVEDNPDVAAFACSLLEELGYATRCAANASEALKVLADGPPVDVVFSDVVMPGGLSGLELASIARTSYPDIPFVLATGYSEQLVHGAAPEDIETLRKPYRPEELASALERAMARRAARSLEMRPEPPSRELGSTRGIG